MRLSLVPKWLALTSPDRGLLVSAWIELGRVDLELRTLGFRRLVDQIERIPVRDDLADGEVEVRRAQHYAQMVELASRHHVLRAQCLHRSLTLHRWLRREGVPSVFRIGIRRNGAALEAHAWIDVHGVVVTDAPNVIASFQPLGSHAPPAVTSSQFSFTR